MPTPESVIVTREDFDVFFDALRGRGYEVIGPTVRDGAITFEEIESVADLPEGWTEEQDAGTYRLHRREDAALFGYSVGPQSWKRFLHPERLKLWESRRAEDGSMQFEAGDEEALPPRAFLGVRSCDLHAIAIQDRVFLGNAFTDPAYQRRRDGILLVAVNCATAGGTCFCASMNTGPGLPEDGGYDIALTEFVDGNGHRFLATAGSETGAEILSEVPSRPAEAADLQSAAAIVERTAASMGRTLESPDSVPGLLLGSMEHPHWDEVAERCLSCANCTLVCPTCFCTTVDDVTDLSGETSERWRRWDSCFTLDFTWMSAGSARQSGRSRYRQWLTHKMATWHDQFGTSGCVGCGRCISWCPVGIDITEETTAFREPVPAPGSQEETPLPTEPTP